MLSGYAHKTLTWDLPLMLLNLLRWYLKVFKLFIHRDFCSTDRSRFADILLIDSTWCSSLSLWLQGPTGLCCVSPAATARTRFCRSADRTAPTTRTSCRGWPVWVRCFFRTRVGLDHALHFVGSCPGRELMLMSCVGSGRTGPGCVVMHSQGLSENRRVCRKNGLRDSGSIQKS